MKTYIGIDPSFRDGGFALCWLEPAAGEKSQGSGYAVRFRIFLNYADFVEWVFQYKLYRTAERERQLVFCIEDSSLQNCTFDKSGNKAVSFEERVLRRIECWETEKAGLFGSMTLTSAKAAM